MSFYVYCCNHVVAECAACAQSFRQEELGSDPPLDSRTYATSLIILRWRMRRESSQPQLMITA